MKIDVVLPEPLTGFRDVSGGLHDTKQTCMAVNARHALGRLMVMTLTSDPTRDEVMAFLIKNSDDVIELLALAQGLPECVKWA